MNDLADFLAAQSFSSKAEFKFEKSCSKRAGTVFFPFLKF
jgi:hypothetical protein